MFPVFQDRQEAGRELAARLLRYRGLPDAFVLALPRGGVPVGLEIAMTLHLPLDIMIVRKLGVPGHEELAMGAIASGGIQVLNKDVVRLTGVSHEAIMSVAAREQQELTRREQAYRGTRAPVAVEGKTIILVDDGLATGSTMRAAAMALRQQQPARIVVAVPVGSPEACTGLQAEADEVVCAMTPAPFFGVGQWYENFAQTSDEEVRDLLEKASRLTT
jgi:predicted phosphoribosyltransferase